MFEFEARVLIGGLARVFDSQPIRTRTSKSNIFIFMLRWPTIPTASIYSMYVDGNEGNDNNGGKHNF